MILILFVPIIIFSQEQKQKWDYPIKPGSEEWRMTSYAEKLALNQLPNDLTKSLSTSELLEYCLNYPFNKDILLFNNHNGGFAKVFSESLCWQEFLKRPDVLLIFIKSYEKYSSEDIENIKNIDERYNEMFNVFFLEKLVSETDLVSTSDPKMRKLLMTSLLSKQEGRKKYPTQYHGFLYWSALSAIMKILKYEDVISDDIIENTDYKNLKEKGICYNPDIEASIVSIATKQLEK